MQRLAGAVVEPVGGRRVRLRPSGEPAIESALFEADIKLICVHNKGAQISVTLDGFRTEVWDRSFRRRLGLPIAEWKLFSSQDVPQKAQHVSLSADGTRALIDSMHWIPPNLHLSWVSVWDVAGGMPLTSRFMYGSDAGADYDEVRFALSGNQLFLYGSPGTDNNPDPDTRKPDFVMQLEMASEHKRKIGTAELTPPRVSDPPIQSHSRRHQSRHDS